ncbi:MAG: acetyl-CoA C-acetyltransferase [Pyrobaculum sp.]|jgi:acetyl-CoA C-acetyltransferase
MTTVGRKIENVYLVAFARTAFTRFSRREPQRDDFWDLRPEEIAAVAVRHLFDKTHIPPEAVDDLLTGTALPVGEQWLYGGRHVVYAAKLPYTIPAAHIDRQCASSITTVGFGALEIATGMADVVIAGGVEKMSKNPMYENPHIEINPKFLTEEEYVRLYNLPIGYVMGLTAERLAEVSGIKREEMDAWSYRSHKKAVEAYEKGYFREEIVPVEVEREGQRRVINSDQSVRPDTTLEALAKLPPVFKPDGVITAGNSSPLNSGAAYVMLASGEAVKKYGLEPLAKIRAVAFAGVPPEVMGMGPVPASKKALEKAGLTVRQIGRWEINEAFAVVTLYAIKELGLDPEVVNTRGGAIAIGHPLGATGARIIGTLARQLQIDGVDFGVATLCVGGGQGAALVLERV